MSTADDDMRDYLGIPRTHWDEVIAKLTVGLKEQREKILADYFNRPIKQGNKQMMKLEVGMIPYSDGSGHQVTAIVEKTDEGLMLEIHIVHRISIDQWKLVQDTISTLVSSARDIEAEQI